MTAAQRILNRPIAEWPQAIQSTRADLQDLESELRALIQRAALLEGYLSYRYNTGCGDMTHAAAARHANRQLVKVREAMGFSYPKNVQIQIQ